MDAWSGENSWALPKWSSIENSINFPSLGKFFPGTVFLLGVACSLQKLLIHTKRKKGKKRMNELSSWYTSSSTYPSLKMKKTIAFGHYSTFSPFIQNDWRTHLLSILFTQHATFQTKSSLKRVKIYVKLTVTARWNHHCQKENWQGGRVEKKIPGFEHLTFLE